MMCNPVSTPYRDWHGYEEEEPSFRVHEHAWELSVMLIFATFNVFHNIQSTMNT